MFKFLFSLLFMSLSFTVHSYNYDSGKKVAENAYQKAITHLSNIKSPQELMGSIFKGIPKEANLKPSTYNDELKRLGSKALNRDVIGQILSSQAKERIKQKSSKNNDEVEISNKIISHAEIMVNGGCYKEPSNCKTENKIERCIDSVQYKDAKDINELKVELEVLSSSPREYKPFSVSWYQPIKINLSACNYDEYFCNKQQLVLISKDCQQLKVSIKSNGYNPSNNIQITKAPSCASPTVEFYDRSYSGAWGRSYTVNVKQIGLSDTWVNTSKHRDDGALCYPTGESQCLQKNHTKIINGIPVSRPCWREEVNYQCMQREKGSCDALAQKSCNQIKSECQLSNNNLCLKYAQTFQCSKTTCSEEKEICYQAVDCADGSCQSEAKKNSDPKEMGEGLVNLAALSGGASDVKNQNLSDESKALIFSATNYSCRKDGFGIGNCCVDRSREFSCNEAGEKAILEAKEKNLAVYVGTYENGWFGAKKRESWCVFKSRLAYLIRVSGGLGQLGIGFGTAYSDINAANCQGLTPLQLSQVKLDKINLGELEAEVKALFKEPSSSSSINGNTKHIEDLNRKGSSYDS